MYVAAGPVSAAGNSGADVMVSRADTGQTVIRTDVDGDGELSDDPVFDTIAGPYPTGGARLAAGDTDHSGLLVEMITAPTTGSRRLQVYDDDADAGALLSDNPLDDSFNPFPGNAAGEYVAFGRAASVVAYADPTTPVEITDNSSTFATINVPASAGIIRDLDVTLNISGGLDSDLDVTLTHVPTVTSQPLFTDVGNRHHGFQVRLTDQTGTDIASAPNEPNHPPLSGTFKPEAPALLSTFNGIDASGTWRLGITDDTALNAATLRDWTLRITY
jgi:hypothetical protein